MKNLKLYYSVTMFTLSTIMLALLPICTDVLQYVLLGFLLIMGYAASVIVFIDWKDKYFSEKDYNNGYRDGWADCKKSYELLDAKNQYIKTFKNLEGYSYDGEEEIL